MNTDFILETLYELDEIYNAISEHNEKPSFKLAIEVANLITEKQKLKKLDDIEAAITSIYNDIPSPLVYNDIVTAIRSIE